MFTPDAKDNERQEWERQIAEMSVPEKGGEGLHWRCKSTNAREGDPYQTSLLEFRVAQLSLAVLETC